MVTITNCQEWLDDLDNCNVEDIYNLYESIIGVTQLGGFTCIQKNGIIFLQTDDHHKILMLIHGKDVKAFLDKLDREYGGKIGWVGGMFETIRNKNIKL